MCGGFTCSKNSLIALNVLYVVVAITLIIVAAYAKFASVVTSISLVSGIIACGIFLLIISVVGIIGASLHHQVLLFFYMVILFIIFIIQFSVACACLAVNTEQQHVIANKGWKIANLSVKKEAQLHFHCCGYTDNDGKEDEDLECVGPNHQEVVNPQGTICCKKENYSCCNNVTDSACHCKRCNKPLWDTIHSGLSTVGGIGLFFSFTEILGFILAKQHRHRIPVEIQ